MQKLLIATNNQGKVNEIRNIFTGMYDEILSLKEAGIVLDIVENGTTYEENAILKACEVTRISGMDALADDSGLEVYALGNEPGIYSARYLGEETDQNIKNESILQRLKDMPTEKRGARFVCCIALARPGKPPLAAYGYCEGVIAESQLGEGGFGYDPIFLLTDHGMTFGQLEQEKKNKLSHRYNALLNLRDKIIQERSK